MTHGRHLGLWAGITLLGGALLLPPAAAAQGAGQPSEQEMLNALKSRSSRAPGAVPLAPAPEERGFIDALRQRPIRSITEEDRSKVAEIVQNKPSIDLEINFDFNSATLNQKTMPLAMRLGRTLLSPELKGVVFLVGGYTDAKGADSYNLDLSRRRAEAIKAFLVQSFGVPAANLIPVGFGKEHPKNPDNPFADENRRVQIVNMLGAE